MSLDDIWEEYFEEIGLNKTKEMVCVCRQCNTHSAQFITCNGDLLCPGCGFVQEERVISDDPEWNNYVEEGVVNSSGMRCGNVLDPTNPSILSNSCV